MGLSAFAALLATWCPCGLCTHGSSRRTRVTRVILRRPAATEPEVDAYINALRPEVLSLPCSQLHKHHLMDDDVGAEPTPAAASTLPFLGTTRRPRLPPVRPELLGICGLVALASRFQRRKLEEFQKFGKVEGVALYQDQTSAHVDFEKLKDAICAYKSLNGRILGGEKLCVDFQRSKRRAVRSEQLQW